MPKVLLIDDDPGIVEVLSIILREHHFEVVATEEAEKIEETVTAVQPDLILLDIWISGADGRDVFQRLRAHFGAKSVPILMMSAKNDAAVIAQQLKADGFIPKPFDIDELVKTLQTQLARSSVPQVPTV